MRKKITTELRQFRKVNQMCDFGVAHRNAFAPASPGANALGALESAVGHLKIQTAAQASTENRLRELLRIKLNARQDLHEDVERLYHTAHAVALEKPGFDDKFQSSLQGDPKLLNAARSAVKDAAPAAETFVSHAMPQNFIEALDVKSQSSTLSCAHRVAPATEMIEQDFEDVDVVINNKNRNSIRRPWNSEPCANAKLNSFGRTLRIRACDYDVFYPDIAGLLSQFIAIRESDELQRGPLGTETLQQREPSGRRPTTSRCGFMSWKSCLASSEVVAPTTKTGWPLKSDNNASGTAFAP